MQQQGTIRLEHAIRENMYCRWVVVCFVNVPGSIWQKTFLVGEQVPVEDNWIEKEGM